MKANPVQKKRLWAVLYGTLILVAIISLYVISIDQLRAIYAFQTSFGVQAKDLSILTRIWQHTLDLDWKISLLLVAFFVSGLWPRKSITSISFIFSAVVLIGLFVSLAARDGGYGYVQDFSFRLAWPTIAILIVRSLKGKVNSFDLFGGVVPLLTGLLIGWASSNSIFASSWVWSSLWPYLAVNLVEAVKENPFERTLWPHAKIHLANAVCILFSGFLAICAWKSVYDEARIQSATHQIQSGPFKGLFTTFEKSELIYDFADRARHFRNCRSAIVYDNFAAGYLWLAAKPITASLLVAPREVVNYNRDIYVDHLKSRPSRPELVIAMKSKPLEPQTPSEAPHLDTDALTQYFIKLGYKTSEESKWAIYFTAPDSNCYALVP